MLQPVIRPESKFSSQFMSIKKTGVNLETGQNSLRVNTASEVHIPSSVRVRSDKIIIKWNLTQKSVS